MRAIGGHRKGERGRGAGGKVPVFGLLKRGGKVYTKTISEAKVSRLMPIIREKIQPDSGMYTDSMKSDDALNVSELKPARINHSEPFVIGES